MSPQSPARATSRIAAIAAGAVVAVACGVIAQNPFLGISAGVATAALVLGLHSLRGRQPARSMRRDPFTVGEPWRQLVRDAQRAGERLQHTVDTLDPGPLRDRMSDIASRIDHGIDEAWAIAQRGDDIDDTIRRLDPTGLRSKLADAEARRAEHATEDVDAAIESLRSQLASAERLQAESEQTADRLRLTQTRLEELVARAAEITIGSDDTERYGHDVDDVVVELEALHQAIDEVNRA